MAAARTLEPILPDLSVRGFRGLANLNIQNLSRVTLILGKNNTGKSSLLEAVRLLCQADSRQLIRELLEFREENVSPTAEGLNIQDVAATFPISPLFHGFPTLFEHIEPIVISCGKGSHEKRINLSVEWFTEVEDDSGEIRLLAASEQDMDEAETTPAVVVEKEGTRSIYSIELFGRPLPRRRILRQNLEEVPCQFLSSSSIENTGVLGPLWDKIAITPLEEEVVQALRIVDPYISDVSMVGEQSSRQSRTAVVWSSEFERRVPLRSYGDGMNRLFGLILSLANAKGGILLIDEFENGLHYTVQADAWRMVLSLSRVLGIQVLATTHSWDCVVGLAEASEEHEDSGATLIRLDKIGGELRSISYDNENMLKAVKYGTEVR